MSAPRLDLVFSGSYGFDRLERMAQTVEPLLTLEDPRVITVDLRRLVFFGPTALALLLAGLKRARELGLNAQGSAIKPPKSDLIFRYLERMNLFRELVGDLPEEFVRREAMGFRPVQHFVGDDDYWRVAADVVEALAERCQPDSIARAAIAVCLDEVCENVIHHADTPLGGYAAAQGWPKAARSQFEIGIVDLGVGIRTSLARNPTYADLSDDVAAIETALQFKVTATPERNAGIGLFVTSLVLARNGGQLVVRSGRGSVTRGAVEKATQTTARLPGTVVSLRANMDRPLDLAPIYEHLEDLEDEEELNESAVAEPIAVGQDAPDDADSRGHED